jgi:hypothetical protein
MSSDFRADVRRQAWCACCKHHVSAHQYIPDDSKKGEGPKTCMVLGCDCQRFAKLGQLTLIRGGKR